MRTSETESTTRLEAEPDTSCELCGGGGSLLLRRVDDGHEIVVGCPHDATTVEGWERERGLVYAGAP